MPNSPELDLFPSGATKRCTHCGDVKPVSEFSLHSVKTGRLNPWCRACKSSCSNEWRKQNPEKARAQTKAFYQRNREWKREKGKEFNERRRQADGTISIPQILRWTVYRRDGYKCLKCGRWYDLTADHIVPTAQGGLTEEDNLQTLCRYCNSHKGGMHTDYRPKA